LDAARTALLVPTGSMLRHILADAGDRVDDTTAALHMARAVVNLGAHTVVATLGERGCVAADADGTTVTAPGVAIEPYSTLGAGDVFHGALVTAVASGSDLAQACAYANVVAALSCAGLDGRSAIPDHDTAAARAASALETP
jgi:sugar/nucleoside kinase (ribokinase family)